MKIIGDIVLELYDWFVTPKNVVIALVCLGLGFAMSNIMGATKEAQKNLVQVVHVKQ